MACHAGPLLAGKRGMAGMVLRHPYETIPRDVGSGQWAKGSCRSGRALPDRLRVLAWDDGVCTSCDRSEAGGSGASGGTNIVGRNNLLSDLRIRPEPFEFQPDTCTRHGIHGGAEGVVIAVDHVSWERASPRVSGTRVRSRRWRRRCTTSGGRSFLAMPYPPETAWHRRQRCRGGLPPGDPIGWTPVLAFLIEAFGVWYMPHARPPSRRPHTRGTLAARAHVQSRCLRDGTGPHLRWTDVGYNPARERSRESDGEDHAAESLSQNTVCRSGRRTASAQGRSGIWC